MPKGTKNIITRADVEKDILHSAKAGLYSNLIMLFPILLIFVPLIILGIYTISRDFLLGLLFALLCAAFLAISFWMIIRDAMEILLIKLGSFSIVKDTVCRLSKEEMTKNSFEGRAPLNVIYFTKYGRYPDAGMNFSLASEGDEFYLAILHKKKKDKIYYIYHTMMYECKEIN